MFDAPLCHTVQGLPLGPLFWPATPLRAAEPLERYGRRFRPQPATTWLLFAAKNLCRLVRPLRRPSIFALLRRCRFALRIGKRGAAV